MQVLLPSMQSAYRKKYLPETAILKVLTDVFRCKNSRCSKGHISQFNKAPFSRIQICHLEQIILFVNLFCAQITLYEHIQFQTQLDTEKSLSSATIADWFSYCRYVGLGTIVKESMKVIGGPGLTVKIDESKSGKRVSE